MRKASYALVQLDHILPSFAPPPPPHHNHHPNHHFCLYILTWVIRQQHPLCYVYTHSWIGKTCLTHDSTPDTRQCHSVDLVVPQHLEHACSFPVVSRTHIEGILFIRLGKDQSSRTLIATMCNFPPPPFCFTSYPFSFSETFGFGNEDIWSGKVPMTETEQKMTVLIKSIFCHL